MTVPNHPDLIDAAVADYVAGMSLAAASAGRCGHETLRYYLIERGIARRSRNKPHEPKVKAARKPRPRTRLSAEAIELLTTLWNQSPQLSAAQIGERLWRDGQGMNRNQVLGHAHRLYLPKRVSPLGSGARAYDTRRIEVREEGKRRLHRVNGAKAHEAKVVRLHVPKIVPTSPFKACQWPKGSKGDDAGWRFCGEPTVPGRSYCGEHHQRSVRRSYTAEESADWLLASSVRKTASS